MGHKGLLGVEDRGVFRKVYFLQESLINIGRGGSCLEAENRGIAYMWPFAKDLLSDVDPIVDHAVPAFFIVEKAIDPVHDGNIEIKEQGRAGKIAKALTDHAEFNQNMRPPRRDSGIFGERNDVHIRMDATRIISAAVEDVRAGEVFARTGVEIVDVVRRVAISIFQADDVHRDLVGCGVLGHAL